MPPAEQKIKTLFPSEKKKNKSKSLTMQWPVSVRNSPPFYVAHSQKMKSQIQVKECAVYKRASSLAAAAAGVKIDTILSAEAISLFFF